MVDKTDETCPDCSAAMSPILVVDKTHPKGGMHHLLQYTLPGEKPSIWTGKFPIKGTVGAAMCGECGRILLRGIPTDQ